MAKSGKKTRKILDFGRKKSQKYIKNKVKFLIITGTILLLIIIILTVFGIGIYKYEWNNKATKFMTSIFPYPAAIIDYTNFVTIKKYQEEMNYQKSFDNSMTEKEILDELIKEGVISKLAQKYKITVTNQEIENNWEELISSLPGKEEEYALFIKEKFGWSVKQYKEKIIKKRLLQEKVAQKIVEVEGLESEAKNKAEAILNQLKQGKTFSEISKENKNDSYVVTRELVNSATGENFVSIDNAVAELNLTQNSLKNVFSLKVGEISSLVKSPVVGYYIIKINDKKGNEIKASYIVVKIKSFNEWLQDHLKTYKIWRLI